MMPTRDLLLGIDVGTTACKAAAVDLDGVEVAHGRVRLRWKRMPSGAQIHPDALVAAALAAGADALTVAGEGRVVAIGVTSMAETGVLLDAKGHPVVPSIAWHDERGSDQCSRLAADIGRDRFIVRTGLAMRPLSSVVKYRWLRDNVPAAAAGVRWLSVAEWVAHRFGGDQAAELSLASRTGFLDIGAGAWWDATVAWSGAPDGLLPELRTAGASWGRAAASTAGSRLAGAALTVAGHDHLCGAVGAGATDPRTVFDSCGTAEAFVRAVAAPPMSEPAVLAAVAGGVNVGRHILPGHQALLGAQRAGLSLQRFLDLLGVGGEGRDALEKRACALDAHSGTLRVLDATSESATLAGIGRSPSPAMVWRAAVEAVVESGCRILDVIAETGPVDRVVVGGGWAHSPTLREVKRADVRYRVEFPDVVEACARGAALLGGCAAGVFADPLSVPHPVTALGDQLAGSRRTVHA